MKDKKFLIVALLGMAFQVEAGRSPLREDSEDDVQEAPKHETLKKEHKKKQEKSESSEKTGRNALHERMAREEGEHDRRDKMHTERRQAERERKHEAYEERKKTKKESDHKGDRKSDSDRTEKKSEKPKHQHSEGFKAAERRDQARIKAEEKREQSLKKRRDVADKRVSRLEDTLDKLEDKRQEKLDSRDDTETRVIPSHIINKSEGTKDLDKDINNVKARLKTREEQARKLSAEYKDESRDEYKTRTVLAKVYASEQRDLRRALADVKDSLALLRVKEKKDALALADDRDAYEAVHRDMRAHRAVKDMKGARKDEKKLGISKSDSKEVLDARLKAIKDDLDAIRIKIADNDKGIDAAARRAGLEPRKEQKRKEDLDRYIKEDRENDTRLLSEKRRQIENRKEDLAYKRSKAEKKKNEGKKPETKKPKAVKEAS